MYLQVVEQFQIRGIKNITAFVLFFVRQKVECVDPVESAEVLIEVLLLYIGP